VLEISVVSPRSLVLLDDNYNIIVLFTETSSDEDTASRPSFASHGKKRRTNESDFGGSSSINTSRNTVIVSPSKNNAGSDRPSMFALNATSSQSSSQESSDSSDEDDVRPSIHQSFIKPKPAAQPIIDQKAKNMMVNKFVKY
jgi:hypothetical protein